MIGGCRSVHDQGSRYTYTCNLYCSFQSLVELYKPQVVFKIAESYMVVCSCKQLSWFGTENRYCSSTPKGFSSLNIKWVFKYSWCQSYLRIGVLYWSNSQFVLFSSGFHQHLISFFLYLATCQKQLVQGLINITDSRHRHGFIILKARLYFNR